MANFTPQEMEQFLQEFFDVVGARQYIGARYVPIFGRAGSNTVEWDDLAPYEPLTVVMHDGVSYVSRRYVPAGIPITDTAYWVETYRYNAQVEQYRQEVLSFQGQIDGIRDDLESDYVPFPDSDHYPKYGTSGQVLTTLADGETKWEDPVVPSDAQAEEVIGQWLEDHPEATTTVQDNSVTNAKLIQSGGILSAVRSIQGTVMMGYGRYVNYDTVAGTITFPKDCVIVMKQQNGNFSSTSLGTSPYVITDVTYTAIGTSAIRLYYDITNGAIEILGWRASVPENYIYLCSMRLPYDTYPPTITADFPWSINGVPYGYVPPNNSITDAKLIQSGGILSAVRSIQATVMMGAQRYVDYDTTAGTITFPSDCVIVMKQQNGNFSSRSLGIGSYVITDVTQDAIGSSAIRLYYDITNSGIEILKWNASVPENYIYLCSVRLRYPGYAAAFTADFPWSINGVPYGHEIPEQYNFSPLIAESSGNAVRSINHRGYNTIAPENTIPAFKLSCEHNFLAVETDISFTSDGVAVLLHDDTINRTARNADGTTISEPINIGSITYAQALEYDFGIWKGEQYAGTKIPTLEEFLKFCRDTGLHAYLEIKENGVYTQAQIEGIVNLVNECGMKGKCSYISFANTYLAYVKNYDAYARIGYVAGTVDGTVISNAAALKTATNEVFVDTNDYTSNAADLCRNASLPIECWTVDSASTILSLDSYVSGVSSNYTHASVVLYEHALES